MTNEEMIIRLDEIRDEYCQTSLDEIKRNLERGYYSPCGCLICTLLEHLTIEELVK